MRQSAFVPLIDITYDDSINEIVCADQEIRFRSKIRLDADRHRIASATSNIPSRWRDLEFSFEHTFAFVGPTW